ncbi:MAG: hypothetical protein AAFR21_11545 [Pseudomonadota bacterium]
MKDLTPEEQARAKAIIDVGMEHMELFQQHVRVYGPSMAVSALLTVAEHLREEMTEKVH